MNPRDASCCATRPARRRRRRRAVELGPPPAGIVEQSAPTLDQSVEAFDRVLNVHLRGTFLMSREVAKAMLAQGSGPLVNIASIAGQAGISTRNAYGAAKAGIAAMTRTMACGWARSGLRVNAVEELERKGTLDTKAIAARTPMARLAQPAEIAEVITFLASSKASFVTGATLNADGGWLALGAPASVLAKVDAA